MGSHLFQTDPAQETGTSGAEGACFPPGRPPPIPPGLDSEPSLVVTDPPLLV